MSDEKNKIHHGNQIDQRDNQGNIVLGDQIINNNINQVTATQSVRPYKLNLPAFLSPEQVFGREDDADKIHQCFDPQNRILSIQAIGGIGKTTASLYYAERYRSEYTHAVWINGDISLKDGLLKDNVLQQNLGIDQEVERFAKQDQYLAAFNLIQTTLLRLSGKVLLIIDNANTNAIEQARTWKQANEGFYFLISSREKNDAIPNYTLSPIKSSLALDLFYHWAGRQHQNETNDAHLLQLFTLIDYHTQAIVLLAKTFKKELRQGLADFCTRCTPNFVQGLPNKNIKIDNRQGEEKARYILIQLFTLAGISERKDAVYLLTQAAALPHYDLEFPILDELLCDADFTSEQLEAALIFLDERGWIDKQPTDPPTFNYHRLIQEAVRAQQNTTDDTYTPLVQKIQDILSKNNNTRFWENKPYLPYAIAIEQLLSQENKLQAYLCNEIGFYYSNMNDFEKEFYYYQKSLDIREKVLGKKHADTALAYNNIGTLYSQKDDLDSALAYYQKALDIREKVLGTEHANTAQSYNNIGTIYYKKNDFDKALNFYEKVLVIQEKTFNTENNFTAITYNNIGFLYYQKGNLDIALDYYQKALVIKEKILGKEHIDMAISYNNMGLLYYEKNNFDTTLKYYQKALAIKEKILGTEHTDTATSYNNIGALYKSKGNLGKALKYMKKDLAICEKVLGTEHTDTAISYHNIGNLYYEKGVLDTALNFIQKAYNIFKNKLGDEHPNTKTSYKWLQIIQAAIQKRENDKNQ